MLPHESPQRAKGLRHAVVAFSIRGRDGARAVRSFAAGARGAAARHAQAAPRPHSARLARRARRRRRRDVHGRLRRGDVPRARRAAAAAAYEARRHEPGGGRRDTLAWGRVGATAYLRLSIYRLGQEAEPDASLFVEAARRAGEIGYAVTRLGAADATPTRFGAMETADATLARGASEAHCLAFRLIPQDGDEVMRLSGLSCGAPAQPIDRAALACQIDRLDLRSAGDDAALRRLFVQAERKRDRACAPSRVARAGWLEPAGSAPTLRGPAGDADPAPTQAIVPKKRKAARAR
ncbi:MAG: hypothetical protein IPL88_03770 [Rhizobiales bacterium]|nr:hypothetical protein [Hyphomicrobiales bacterium]